MRRIFFRSLMFCLAGVLVVGLWGAWRVWNVGRTAYGAYHHLRYLLESGETIEGAPANDVLSDSYLLGLFGNNAELADKLKAIIDLGMATDESLKTGEVTAMVVTYRQTKDGDISDPAIYAVGGFTNPKHTRFGFHSSGYFAQELDRNLWLSGNSVMNMLGRDIIVFCEQDKAEQHMSLLSGLLNGRILPLASRIVEAPLHYAIVFPAPREIAPPNLRNYLSVISVAGVMGPDDSSTEIRFVTGHPAKTARVQAILSDMLGLARMTFHDKFSGYIKEREWGTQNDMWWATEYVSLIDTMSLVSDPTLVAIRFSGDRAKNNAILKTLERAGCDLSAQKAFALSDDLPWEYVYNDRDNPHGGYWSKEHQWGDDWPLGDAGIPTPGSIAAAAERERIRAEREAEKAAKAAEREAAAAEPAKS
jgi:hypothetical protein